MGGGWGERAVLLESCWIGGQWKNPNEEELNLHCQLD